jgi:hypothetical protein
MMNLTKPHKMPPYIYPSARLVRSTRISSWRRPHFSRNTSPDDSGRRLRCLHVCYDAVWRDVIGLRGLCGRSDVGLRDLCGVLGGF